MSLIATTEIVSLLWPGLNAIFGMDYKNWEGQWSQIFDKHSSDKYKEEDVEMAGLGYALERPEGSATRMDTMGERYKYTYVHRNIALAFAMTANAIEDNLYKTRFGAQTRYLVRSFQQTKEVYGANILNFGFDTNFPGGDTVPLFSVLHPLDAGVGSNTFATQAELNETSLQDAVDQIRDMRDARGLRVNVQPQKLIVARQGFWVADRLLYTTRGRPGTDANDRNTINSQNIIPQGFAMNVFLTNQKFWAIKTDCPEGMKYFERSPFRTDMTTDFLTDNLMIKGHERYSFGWSNWRSMFGANPT